MSTIYLSDGAAHAAIRLGGAMSAWGGRRLSRHAAPTPDRTGQASTRRTAETRYEERKLDAARLQRFH